MNAYTIAGITIESTTYRQLTNISVDPGIEKMINTGGQTDAVFSAIRSQKPMCRFSSPNLGLFMGLAGASGAAITATVVVYFAKLVHGGTRSYSACFKATFNDGMFVLRKASASNGQEGSAEYELYGTFDGTNAPVIFAGSATCPAEGATVAKFTNGPFKIGTTTIESQSNEFDTGFDIGQYSVNGKVYDEAACILARKPVMRVQTLDLGAIDTLTASGAGDDVTMYFTKKTNQGANVANATEEHISLVAALAHITPGVIEGSEGKEATATIESQLLYNLTDAIVVIDTTAAIA